jgi:hypothetical protein
VHDLPYSLAWFDGTSAISLSHGVATTNNFTNYSSGKVNTSVLLVFTGEIGCRPISLC